MRPTSDKARQCQKQNGSSGKPQRRKEHSAAKPQPLELNKSNELNELNKPEAFGDFFAACEQFGLLQHSAGNGNHMISTTDGHRYTRILQKETKKTTRRGLDGIRFPHFVPSCVSCLSWLWVFLLTAAASASPSSALREYKAGKYDQALREYDQLLKRHSDDPRLHFNAGAAAYKNREFEAAVKQFNEALAAPDLKLQALAYYNQGNSLYHLGERAPDPAKRSESWEKSLQDYDSAMKLNPQDADAKFNYEFVKKKLEELKQQQKKDQPQNIQPSEAAKKAKAEADEAVRRRQYARALQIMETQLKEDPTTGYYGDFIQKLKEVTGVQDSAKH
jgi:tetratricopeptide (TPR) repeat protein